MHAAEGCDEGRPVALDMPPLNDDLEHNGLPDRRWHAPEQRSVQADIGELALNLHATVVARTDFTAEAMRGSDPSGPTGPLQPLPLPGAASAPVSA